MSYDLEASLTRAVEAILSASRVIVLSGAGMSTAAGIPDFRSPGGLYGSSEKLLEQFTFIGEGYQGAEWQRRKLKSNITNALTFEYFQANPLTYHEMRRGFILGIGAGQWKPTIGHIFPEILNRNGKLRMLASQNIDGLDHQIISDKAKLYNPHGLMSTLMTELVGPNTPLCSEIDDPVYQRYLELVRDNTKDIYAEQGPRQGKSSHMWPAPEASTPITLAMFGDLLPQGPGGCIHRARETEASRKVYTLKPGSVMFDRHLWQHAADGSSYNPMSDVPNCDLVLVMGTSLSGLTIDNVAHGAGHEGKPRVIFDMTDAPVKSIKKRKRDQGTWHERDSFVQGPLDATLLEVLHRLGWLDQVFEFLPQISLNSLNAVKDFATSNGLTDRLGEVDAAITQEIEREKRFYGE